MIINFIKLIVFSVALLSLNVQSLELGKIILKSNQNSPLDVSIQVSLSNEDKIEFLKPSIAAKENYDSQGIERTEMHDDILLSLTAINSNMASLNLKSKVAVMESYLDLLIQIDSPSGKILKEYTILLDPPLKTSPRKKNQETKEVNEKNKSENIKKVEIKKITKKKKNVQISKKKKTVIAVPGKTLFQIARENSFAGITTEQIVIAIYQTNSNSFDGNLNGLIKGKKLTLPLRDYYKKLSHLEARKVLKRENTNWDDILQSKNKKNREVKKKEIKKKVVEKQKVKIKIVEKKKDIDELSRLKKELEIANKKLVEKEKALKAIENSNQKLINQKNKGIKAKENIQNSIDNSKQFKKNLLMDDNNIAEEQSSVSNSNTFISSVTDLNQNIIQEVVIDDEENNKPIKPIFVLLLLFLLTLLLGLLFMVRKRKKEVNVNHFSGLSETFENDTNEGGSIINRSDSNENQIRNSLQNDSFQNNTVSDTKMNVTDSTNNNEDDNSR